MRLIVMPAVHRFRPSAEFLGKAPPNISDWENNISRPEYENLIALSKLYDETLESLPGLEEG